METSDRTTFDLKKNCSAHCDRHDVRTDNMAS